MNRRHIFSISAIAVLGLATLPTLAVAQQKSLKEQLVGTWTLVSFDAVKADGTKTPAIGAKAKGIMMIDARNNYTIVFANPDRSKKWGKNRDDTTAEDYKAAAMGLTAQFGTVSVDEAASTLTTKVAEALNPMLEGSESKKKIAISGDDLKVLDTSSAYGGVSTEQLFKRVK